MDVEECVGADLRCNPSQKRRSQFQEAREEESKKRRHPFPHLSSSCRSAGQKWVGRKHLASAHILVTESDLWFME